MLTSLSIRNYAIIEEIDFHPERGLNVITGETGAGKSILLGALGLVLGNRADLGVLKKSDEKCIVEGIFQIEGYGLKSFFDERDLDYSEELILRREILPAGKSRAFINDTPVRLSDITDLAASLVDLHQQFSSLDIYQKNYQLSLLDAMADNHKIRDRYRTIFSSWNKLRTQLEDLREKERQSSQELDFFQFQFDELEEAGLEAGEQKLLEEELASLENYGDIKSALHKVSVTLENESSGITERMEELIRELEALASVHGGCKTLSERLEQTHIELRDIAGEAMGINDDLEFDPNRAEFLNNRLDSLYRLQKKHGLESVEELIELRENLDEKIRDYSSLGDRILELEKSEASLRESAQEKAAELTETRISAAEEMERLCGDLLEQLSMPHANLKIELESEGDLFPEGRDRVRFLFSANKGMEFRDLRQVASGGEVSRLNLAIKSIIAGRMHLPTLIFDEIDSGVSGDVALKMGRILKKIAKDHQVVVITHSPQVAAGGKKHFYIHKTNDGNSTATRLEVLGDDKRIAHIAVMLSSDPPGSAAIENAKELIKLNE